MRLCTNVPSVDACPIRRRFKKCLISEQNGQLKKINCNERYNCNQWRTKNVLLSSYTFDSDI